MKTLLEKIDAIPVEYCLAFIAGLIIVIYLAEAIMRKPKRPLRKRYDEDELMEQLKRRRK